MPQCNTQPRSTTETETENQPNPPLSPTHTTTPSSTKSQIPKKRPASPFPDNTSTLPSIVVSTPTTQQAGDVSHQLASEGSVEDPFVAATDSDRTREGRISQDEPSEEEVLKEKERVRKIVSFSLSQHTPMIYQELVNAC